MSVVISSRNRPLELSECLRSIGQAVSADDEIIVVDSDSADASAVREVVVGFGAKLLRLELPGSARARNEGILNTKGDIIAFTDDDAIVEYEWLEKLVSGFIDPAVSAVVGPVFEMGSEPQRLLYPSVGFDAASERATFSRSDPDWFARLRTGPIGLGANLAVRRSVFDQYGLFRESLGAGAPIGGDENYFLLALIENGGTVVNEPLARVYHPRQPDERHRAMRNSRLAYLLYVFFTRPRLRLPMLFSVLRRASRGTQMPSQKPVASDGILRELISAPTLLMEALRIDRAESARRRRH